MLVDPATRTKGPAFDHTRLAAALGRAAAKSSPPSRCRSRRSRSATASERSRFTDDDGAAWTCTLSDYTCTRAQAAARAPGRRRRARRQGGGGGGAGGGRGGRGAAPADAGTSTSPDGTLVAFIRDRNIYVRPATSRGRAGERDHAAAARPSWPYTVGGIVWSPDSKKIAASRIVKRGDRRMVRYVESSPADQVQPKTFERFYAKPGDALDQQERVLIDVAGEARDSSIDSALFPNPYNLSRDRVADATAARFTFEYNQRGHQLYRVDRGRRRDRRRARR